MTPLETDQSQPAPNTHTPRPTGRHDLLALAALGLIIGLACRGHFVMPFADFFEFADSGHAWLRGELPETLKRAPVYPLLVAGLGQWLPGEAPEKTFAEWLNALLLPCNAILLCLIGRRWFGSSARWAAVWYLLLPLGLYCTAHVIVAPLLTCLILLAIYAAQRNSAWAYVAAAAATMTRYDAAGLLPGLLLADLLARRPWKRSLLSVTLATLPLVAWLILTTVTWGRGTAEHYLSQILADRGLRLGDAWNAIALACFDPRLADVPAWSFLPDAVRTAGHYLLLGLPLLALVGALRLLRSRDRAAAVAVAAFAGHLLVHSIFPFKMPRFGYPPIPILLLFTCAGLTALCDRLRQLDQRRRATLLLIILAGLLCAWGLVTEARAFATAVGGTNRLFGRLGLLLLITLPILWAAPYLRRGHRLARITLLLAMSLLAVRQLAGGQVDELLGPGDNLKNEVEAARWIRQHASPDARVLSAAPGLLRLYIGYTPADRFLSFHDIRADAWPDILAECRQRNIQYIIWHADLGHEHGPHYVTVWRLARFEVLNNPDHAPGVCVERRYVNYPNLVIVRVL